MHQTDIKKLNQRLSAFIADRYPDEEVPVEALCKDKNGTYVIPYSCCRFDDEWRNFETDETVTANIIGWRPISEKQRSMAKVSTPVEHLSSIRKKTCIS